MKLATAGQLMRIQGLLCELLGILGITILSARGVSALPPFLGNDPDTVFKTMVIFGFVFWMCGQILIYYARVRKNSIDKNDLLSSRNDLRL